MAKIVMTQKQLQIILMIFHYSYSCSCTKTTNRRNYFDCTSALLTAILKGKREDFHLKHVSEKFVLKELSRLNSYKSTDCMKLQQDL